LLRGVQEKSKAHDFGVWRFGGGVEVVHAAELHAAIERRGGKAAHLDAGPAGPKRDVRIAGNLLVAVRRADGTSVLPTPSTAISTASWKSISVTVSPA
jgi:hypothetical protein